MRINPEAGLCSHLLAASTSPTTNSGNTAVRQASLRAHHLLAFPLGLPACCATLPVSNLNCNLKRTMASSSRPNQNIGRILLSEKGGEWQPFSSYGRWACLASDNVPSLHGHVFFFFQPRWRCSVPLPAFGHFFLRPFCAVPGEWWRRSGGGRVRVDLFPKTAAAATGGWQVDQRHNST